jgi:hypothetical protein
MFGEKRKTSRPSTPTPSDLPAVTQIGPGESIQATASPVLPNRSHSVSSSTDLPGDSSSITSTAVPLASDPSVISAKSPKDPAIVIDNIAIALEVAEKFADVLQTAPFVAPVANLISQFLVVYKVCSNNHHVLSY